jgi:hypothetical protein
MQLKIFISILLLLAIDYTVGEKFSFDGYHLIRLQPKTSAHIDYLKASENNPDVSLKASN